MTQAALPIASARRCLVLGLGGLLVLDAALLIALGYLHVGVLLPAGIGIALLAWAWKWQAVQAWRQAKPWHARCWRIGWGLFALWLLSVLWFWSHLFSLGLTPAQVPPVQAIVVLGSGTSKGQPRPALAARLETAAELAKLQPQALIAVCGGVDWGEIESEAEVMARYLTQRYGIAPARIVQEKQSTSTELNLRLSRPLLAERGIAADAPTAIVSSDFHLMRAQGIAQKQGITQVYPVAASTPWITRVNVWLREYFAMLSSWVLREV